MRDSLGIALVLMQVVFLIPLYVHILRTKQGAGQSLVSEAIWVPAGLGWAMYGFFTQSIILMVSGSIAMFGSAIYFFLLYWSLQSQRRSAFAAFAVTILFIFSGLIFFGVPGLSFALSAFGLVQFLPQLISSWKLLVKGGDVSGISPYGTSLRILYTAGWALYAAAWSIWSVYGDTSHSVDMPLLVWGAAGAVAFSLQLIAYLRNSPRRS